jgi:hypothetical protein
MVFSNNINQPGSMGTGYVVPLKVGIRSQDSFDDQMKCLAKAEGISNNRICNSWGTVCLAINPYSTDDKKATVHKYWSQLVNNTKKTLTEKQREPTVQEFGEEDEKKSIDKNWNLTINLNTQFRNELRLYDAVAATANAMNKRDQNDQLTYPTNKEIAAAIHHKNYFKYFLCNTRHAIRTYQDRSISKILKKAYRISLKEKRKGLCCQ